MMAVENPRMVDRLYKAVVADGASAVGARTDLLLWTNRALRRVGGGLQLRSLSDDALVRKAVAKLERAN